MADIGYGYGSEYQLMRFMGRHRELLEWEISRQIGQVGDFRWLDFGFSDRNFNISGDSEIKGLSFLPMLNLIDFDTYMSINDEYSSYHINNLDNWQNWDAIFILNDTAYLVEAKAHYNELSSGKMRHGGDSSDEILRFMKDQLPHMNVTEEWLHEYYQLANRLATTALLNKHGLKCRTLCIYFVNGYLKRMKENNVLKVIECKDTTKDQFKTAISKEMSTLGIQNEQLHGLMAPPVFIDANPEIPHLDKLEDIDINDPKYDDFKEFPSFDNIEDPFSIPCPFISYSKEEMLNLDSHQTLYSLEPSGYWQHEEILYSVQKSLLVTREVIHTGKSPLSVWKQKQNSAGSVRLINDLLPFIFGSDEIPPKADSVIHDLLKAVAATIKLAKDHNLKNVIIWFEKEVPSARLEELCGCMGLELNGSEKLINGVVIQILRDC